MPEVLAIGNRRRDLSDQQSVMAAHPPERSGFDEAEVLVEDDVGLEMLELLLEDAVEPPEIRVENAIRPCHESSPPPDRHARQCAPSLPRQDVRGHAEAPRLLQPGAVLVGPCSLKSVVVHENVVRIVAQCAEVGRIEVRHAEQGGHSRFELLAIRALTEAGVVRVEVPEKGRIVGVQDQESHRRLSLPLYPELRDDEVEPIAGAPSSLA